MDNNNNNLNSNLSEEQKISLRNALIQYAKQFEGNPYVYGGNSLTNGIDCSGFTRYVYNHFGYKISRTSKTQAKDGREVAKSDLQPGDIIIFKNQFN